jgi:hypothetical protein
VTSPSDLKWFDLAPAWAQEMYTALSAQIAAVGSMEGQIMAKVQIDDETLNNAVAVLQNTSGQLETLSSAVEAFIAANPPVPQAQLDALNTALSGSQKALADGQQAAADLAAQNPTPPAGP